MINKILLEAQSQIDNNKTVATQIKSLLNTCNLSKYKGKDALRAFYLAFFNCEISTDKKTDDIELNFIDWSNIYRDLLGNNDFLKKLGYFMMNYYPEGNPVPFSGFIRKFNDQYKTEKDKALMINQANTSAMTVRDGILSVCNTILGQIPSCKNCSLYKQSTLSVLNGFMLDNQKLQEKLLETPVNESASIGDEIDPDVAIVREVSAFLKTIDENTFASVNEGAVDFVKDKAMQIKKFEQIIDERINKRLEKIKKERETRRHQELVEECIGVSNEIKRIIKVLPISLLSPGLAGLVYITSVIIDKRTRRVDKSRILADLKLEIRIIDEKIDDADKKDDKPAKIKLMRAKDKLEREYERIERA